MNLKANLDNVVIKPDPQEEVKGGVLIPSMARARSIMGTVVDVGPGGIVEDEYVQTTLNVGDRVLFSKYAGNDVISEDEHYVIIRERDVLAKVEGEDE